MKRWHGLRTVIGRWEVPDFTPARVEALVQTVFQMQKATRSFLDGHITLSELENAIRLGELSAILVGLDICITFEGSRQRGSLICRGCLQTAYEAHYRKVVGPIDDFAPRLAHNH